MLTSKHTFFALVAMFLMITRLSKDPWFRPDSVGVAERGASTDIIADGLIIATITDGDAEAAGAGRQALARQAAQTIRTAIEEAKRARSLKSILLGVLYSLIATVVMVVIFRLLHQLFPKWYGKIDAWRGTHIRAIRFQKLELLPAERIAGALTAVLRLLRLILSLVVLYLYAFAVLSFFPWTARLATALLGYIVSPLATMAASFAAHLPDLFSIAAVIAVTFYLLRFIHFVFRELEKGTIQFSWFYPEWADSTYKIVRLLVIAFAIAFVFPYIPGSQSQAFRYISLFLGVLVSLGSTSAIANLFAGVVLVYTRAFQVGDRVKIGDAIGDVMERALLVTRVRTIKNEYITIPNSLALASHVVNYSFSSPKPGLILHTSVTIGYDAPWRKVHELLIAAARATEHVLPDSPPFVLQTSLNDFYVTYQLNAYTDQPQLMQTTYVGLHANIQDKFNEAGVEICSPHFFAARDGNRIAIPDSYIAESYIPPAFRVASPASGQPAGA